MKADRIRLDHPSQLRWSVRVLIGLMQTGMSVGQAARTLKADYQEVRSLWARLNRWDAHPVVREAVVRLPPTAVAELPTGTSIYCYACNSQINVVPCVRCSARAAVEEAGCPLAPEVTTPHPCEADYLAIPPEQSTAAWPGSFEKIEIMRERVARGESCFHPDDQKGYAVLPLLCDTVSDYEDDYLDD